MKKDVEWLCSMFMINDWFGIYFISSRLYRFSNLSKGNICSVSKDNLGRQEENLLKLLPQNPGKDFEWLCGVFMINVCWFGIYYTKRMSYGHSNLKIYRVS